MRSTIIVNLTGFVFAISLQRFEIDGPTVEVKSPDLAWLPNIDTPQASIMVGATTMEITNLPPAKENTLFVVHPSVLRDVQIHSGRRDVFTLSGDVRMEGDVMIIDPIKPARILEGSFFIQ